METRLRQVSSELRAHQQLVSVLAPSLQSIEADSVTAEQPVEIFKLARIVFCLNRGVEESSVSQGRRQKNRELSVDIDHYSLQQKVARHLSYSSYKILREICEPASFLAFLCQEPCRLGGLKQATPSRSNVHNSGNQVSREPARCWPANEVNAADFFLSHCGL
ncbi:unnamed protein product [Symbiodinium pilosum]|uniref:Uncharacterized protein n=1 Tax=Symbiodinium pilosum TaxID=2952 RepID=A0A812L3P6_SYMPI|nr:unnamed protein product [Symbiodinium pilosum]